MKRRICEVLGCCSYGSSGAGSASSHGDPNRISLSREKLAASHVTTQLTINCKMSAGESCRDRFVETCVSYAVDVALELTF